MKKIVWLTVAVVAGGWLYYAAPEFLSPMAEAANQSAPRTAAPAPVKPAGDEAAALEARRQQLAEREAALAAKEQELKKLSASLDSRIKELNALRKDVDTSLQQKGKQDDEARKERFRKMLKIYRGLKPEEAGKLLDKLDEELVIEMLNGMDQKTAIKLVPYLNQPRVLKWTRLNLKGN
jgi:flagellar protein FlbB